MSVEYSVEKLAGIVGGTVRGDGSTVIRGVGDVSEAGGDQATWVSRERFVGKLASSRAGTVLAPDGFGPSPMPAILCKNIERSVARLLGAFATPASRPPRGVHATAIVDPAANISDEACIGPHVVIEAGAAIGQRCVLHAGVFVGRGSKLGDEVELFPNVVVCERCRIGNRVVIHPNSVIGADGFGYYFDEGRHHKFPHTGSVVIEDDVEIGACSCVDRSKFGHTIVGAGTKIDNQVQVAHNVRVGRHCILAGHVGIAGSARIGDYCVLGGRAAVLDGVEVGEQTTIASHSVADKPLPRGITASGFPAQEHRKELRERALVRRLPKLLEELQDLARRVEQLEGSTHHRP